MQYVLQTDRLCKKYRHTQALCDCSIHIPAGAIYGFVGENGAGKTTLIRMICGLQKPTSGSFTLFGTSNRDRHIENARQRLAAVVEGPAIYSDMTAEENLKYQYRLLGLPSEQGLPELLQTVRLQDTGKKKVRSFSLGMRQRLAIALALVGGPDFLILDEPTNGLDPQGVIELRELLLRLNRRQQITLLISSHHLDELSRLATHYGFIANGTMRQEISAQELERVCKKCTRLRVSDTQLLARTLDTLQLPYEVLSDTQANVFAEVPIYEMTLALEQIGVRLLSVHEQDETLESYYLNLIGGGKYE